MVNKIVFVSVFRQGEGGGEGRVAHEMARWFSHHYEVVMLCPGDSTGLSADASGFRQFKVRSVIERHLSMPLLDLTHVQKIFAFLDEFKPDVIHIHDPALLGVVAQLWARLHHVPVFYTAHILPSRALDFGASEEVGLYFGQVTEVLVEPYLLNFYLNCDAVVGLNQTTAEEIHAFGYAGPILQIPNGRDLNLYHACRFADPRIEEKVLVFVGFIGKRKNQVFLLEVMQHLPPNYRLVLIGEPFSAAYLDELAQVVTEHHLNVLFTGQMTQNEIALQLEVAHVFVSASKMEVQSLVIIEALASGTPVVGLSNETVDELVDASNGVVLPKECSPEDFAAAVEQVCSLGLAEYQSLCEGARQRVNHLDWSNVMVKTLEGYNTIADQMAAQPPVEPGHELVLKYLSQLPEGRAKHNLKRLATLLTLPPREKTRKTAKAVWLTGLNMTVSTIGYSVLKGPVKLLRRLRRAPKDQ